MPKYHSSDITELAHQLTLSPRRQRLAQIAGAERLLELVDRDKEYPYDFVCYHLTGYRPLKPSKKPSLHGESLISDLVRMIEHLSQAASIPLAAIDEAYQTQDQLSQRLNVSIKTIARWRRRGLSGLRVSDEGSVSRLIFTEKSLQRFVLGNQEMVLRGASFKHLSDAERENIIERAGELIASRRMKLQEVARIIAEEAKRAIETVRYTLRRHDQEHPDEALFGAGGRPKVPDLYHAIYRAHQEEGDIRKVAKRFSCDKKEVLRICCEMRAYELLHRKITYVFHPEFDAPDAQRRILDAPEPQPQENSDSTSRPSADTPAYLRALYDTPLLGRDQERDLFRRYNFCKYRAHGLIQLINPGLVEQKRIAEIERLIESADALQNRIIQANLRLVVSIANRYRTRVTNVFELISDGNMALMRAVEGFDYSRGFKFSTYASWAIMKNFVRSIPQERHRYSRFVTGRDELLDAAPDRASAVVSQPAESEGLRTALVRGMKNLADRERDILMCHYGLSENGRATTLEQLGQRFGVSKERIRQIEKRALIKLKQFLPSSLADYANAS